MWVALKTLITPGWGQLSIIYIDGLLALKWLWDWSWKWLVLLRGPGLVWGYNSTMIAWSSPSICTALVLHWAGEPGEDNDPHFYQLGPQPALKCSSLGWGAVFIFVTLVPGWTVCCCLFLDLYPCSAFVLCKKCIFLFLPTPFILFLLNIWLSSTHEPPEPCQALKTLGQSTCKVSPTLETPSAQCLTALT